MKILLLTVLLLASSILFASETLTEEPDDNSYNYVSHYSIEINAPVEVVWSNLVNFGSWMYEFEMETISGQGELEGQVLRLYEGQDFFMQVTKAIDNELLVIVNLPSSMEGELSTGIAVTSMREINGNTTVNLTMSRRYTWSGRGENHLKSRRQSKTFNDNTRALWNRFLGRLAELSIPPSVDG